jgi:hypothetical protein
VSEPSAHPTFLEVRIGARLPAVRILNDLLDVALRAVGVDEGVRHDLTLGVAELVANVVEHEGGAGEVGLRLDVLVEPQADLARGPAAHALERRRGRPRPAHAGGLVR